MSNHARCETNSAINSESTNNTTSEKSGETDVAMQSIADVEGYVGNSTETVIHSTKIYETPTLEGEPSMGRNGSSSDRDEQGSSGGKIPFKCDQPEGSDPESRNSGIVERVAGCTIQL